MTTLPYMDTDLPVRERVKDLVSRMTLEEKASQMRDQSVAIELLGIPEYNWLSEGVHGVGRAGQATVFPQAIGLAATWDPDLIHEVADAISTEARAKHHEAVRQGDRGRFRGLTLWAPVLNIARDPRWGRCQETYGEDPYLTSRMGVEFVCGLQGDDPRYLKTAAIPKYFAAYSGPMIERKAFGAAVDRRTLHEVYLPAFKACVQEGRIPSIVSSQHRIFDKPCSANPELLREILRDEWGFEGCVASDLGSIRDIFLYHKTVETFEEAVAIAVRSGCDLISGGVTPPWPRRSAWDSLPKRKSTAPSRARWKSGCGSGRSIRPNAFRTPRFPTKKTARPRTAPWR